MTNRKTYNGRIDDDDDNIEWGNRGLGDLTPEDMMRPDINRVINNRLQAQDPNWLAAVRLASSDPKYLEEQSKRSIEKWKDPEFRRNNIEQKYKSWENNEERREKVSKQFKGKQSDEHVKKRSSAYKEWVKTDEGKKIRTEALAVAGPKISKANSKFKFIGTNIQTGEEIICIGNKAVAEKGFTYQLLNRAIKIGRPHKGYTWRKEPIDKI